MSTSEPTIYTRIWQCQAAHRYDGAVLAGHCGCGGGGVRDARSGGTIITIIDRRLQISHIIDTISQHKPPRNLQGTCGGSPPTAWFCETCESTKSRHNMGFTSRHTPQKATPSSINIHTRYRQNLHTHAMGHHSPSGSAITLSLQNPVRRARHTKSGFNICSLDGLTEQRLGAHTHSMIVISTSPWWRASYTHPRAPPGTHTNKSRFPGKHTPTMDSYQQTRMIPKISDRMDTWKATATRLKPKNSSSQRVPVMR